MGMIMRGRLSMAGDYGVLICFRLGLRLLSVCQDNNVRCLCIIENIVHFVQNISTFEPVYALQASWLLAPCTTKLESRRVCHPNNLVSQHLALGAHQNLDGSISSLAISP